MRRAARSAVLIIGVSAAGLACSAQNKVPHKLIPGKMAKTATVDPRFLSYNVEMVEVTGGRFWAPYGATDAAAPPAAIDPPALSAMTAEIIRCSFLRMTPPWLLPRSAARCTAPAARTAHLNNVGLLPVTGNFMRLG